VVDSGASLSENLVGYPGLGRKDVARELLGKDLKTGNRTTDLVMVVSWTQQLGHLPPPNHEGLHRAYVGIFDPLDFTGKWINQMTSNHTHDYTSSDDPHPEALPLRRSFRLLEEHGSC
jgi:hypothetical protein